MYQCNTYWFHTFPSLDICQQTTRSLSSWFNLGLINMDSWFYSRPTRWTGDITQDSPGGQVLDKVDKEGLPELGAESEVGAVPKVRQQWGKGPHTWEAPNQPNPSPNPYFLSTPPYQLPTPQPNCKGSHKPLKSLRASCCSQPTMEALSPALFRWNVPKPQIALTIMKPSHPLLSLQTHEAIALSW